MSILVDKFIDILITEKAVHEELLKLAIEKKEVLIKNDIDVLNNIVSRETEIITLVKELENQRVDLVKQIAMEIEVQKEILTLDEMANHVQDDQKAQLMQIKSELNDIVKKLIDYNDLNKELLKTHLNYTFFSLNVMSQGATPADTYDNSGYMKEDTDVRIGLIDQKV